MATMKTALRLKVEYSGPKSEREFLSLDPLAGDFPGLSPYNYVACNPVNLVDPDGRAPRSPVDDYRLGRNGSLELIRKTNDKFDRFYSYNNQKSITTSKAFTTLAAIGETFVGFSDKASGEKFFKFAAENSDVEFARIDGRFFGTDESSFVFSTQDRNTVESQPTFAKSLSRLFFVADNVDHSHPGGNEVPSGHYGIQEGNPNSLMPVPPSHPNYGRGDAENARFLSRLKGFENARFSVYDPDDKTTTIYDGKNQAKIIR